MTKNAYVLTILASTFTDQGLSLIVHDFHKRPAFVWLLDASALKQFDLEMLKKIHGCIQRLAGDGLRTVALVHPNPLVQSVIRGMNLPVQIQVFAARGLAQIWIQKGCLSCDAKS